MTSVPDPAAPAPAGRSTSPVGEDGQRRGEVGQRGGAVGRQDGGVSPQTGHHEVDAVLAAIADVNTLPAREQVTRYAEAHRALQQTLRTIDGA